ncbi:hypothetical protein [Salipiger mucosus]|uniref:hypothetical protein n=1 Tax=Salipiger mucosus TaxID=263378 RepID=UPI00037A215D|nr:hypothetical protein [Salipiger mucosus]
MKFMKFSMAIVLSSLSVPAKAEETDTAKSAADSCLMALEAGEERAAGEAAITLQAVEGDVFGEARDLGVECLEKFTGEQWLYAQGHKRFMSIDAFKAIDQRRTIKARMGQVVEEIISDTEGLAEQARQNRLAAEKERVRAGELLQQSAQELSKARRESVSIRTYTACVKLYRSNENSALVNPVCNASFVANGLPPSID